MMGELIFRNLLHRPARTLIGIIAISVEVALVVLIVGLTSGLLTETAKRIEGIGADIMLQPPAASIFLGFSGSPMPIKIGDKLKDLKYVQAVAPALLQFNSTGGVEVVYGIDRDSFREVTGGFIFLSGHDMEAADEIGGGIWPDGPERIEELAEMIGGQRITGRGREVEAVRRVAGAAEERPVQPGAVQAGAAGAEG